VLIDLDEFDLWLDEHRRWSTPDNGGEL
jgi:hypothetical protein